MLNTLEKIVYRVTENKNESNDNILQLISTYQSQPLLQYF